MDGEDGTEKEIHESNKRFFDPERNRRSTEEQKPVFRQPLHRPAERAKFGVGGAVCFVIIIH